MTETPCPLTGRHGVSAFPPLDPDRIEHELQTRLVGRRIQVWNRVASTNDLAARAADTPANDGLVILAEEQTAGRGSHGRQWSAPPGASILASILLFPPPEIAQPEALVCLSAVCAAQALQEFVAAPVEIKWPNDLYLAGRKLGGILVERKLGTVIGIGLNIHVPPPIDSPLGATCLADHASGPLDRSAIVRRLLQIFDQRYHAACRDGIGAIVRDWRQRTAFLGECVEIELRHRTLAGTLVEIDPLCSLSLRNTQGQVEVIALTEVQTLRPLRGMTE